MSTGEVARSQGARFDRSVTATVGHFLSHVEQAARDLVVDAVDPGFAGVERRESFGRFTMDAVAELASAPVTEASAGHAKGESPIADLVADKRRPGESEAEFGKRVAERSPAGGDHQPMALTEGSSETRQAVGGKRSKRERPRRGGPDEAEWARRQAALKSETNGERLEPHEIEFLERFEAEGHLAEWIRAGQEKDENGLILPTNDFRWVDRDSVVCELKVTSAKYSKIKSLIARAIKDAKTRGVTKDKFVVDISPRHLGKVLREQLSGYNVKSTKFTVTEIWVMSASGFEQVELK